MCYNESMMKKIHKHTLFLGLLLSLTLLASTPLPTHAASIADRVSGYILLQVQENGEAWYVYPINKRRYYLGRPIDAFRIMRELGLGITNEDLAKIPVAGTAWDAPADVMNRVQGKILLQVEENGEAWYVYPGDKRRYYLGRPDDAFRIMRELGLGVTNSDLEQILKEGDAVPPSADYAEYTINTSRGAFAIKVVSMPKAGITMITDTENSSDCTNNCPAKPLASYVSEHGALAGIHGSYFCPPDYSSCANST